MCRYLVKHYHNCDPRILRRPLAASRKSDALHAREYPRKKVNVDLTFLRYRNERLQDGSHTRMCSVYFALIDFSWRFPNLQCLERTNCAASEYVARAYVGTLCGTLLCGIAAGPPGIFQNGPSTENFPGEVPTNINCNFRLIRPVTNAKASHEENQQCYAALPPEHILVSRHPLVRHLTKS